MEHVAVQKKDRMFIDLKSLDILCRCKSKKDPPFAKVAPGDIVYVAMGSDVRLRTKVRKAESLEFQDVDEVRELTQGTTLYDGEAYWDDVRNARIPRRYGTVVWLTDPEILDPPIQPTTRSYGWDWFVLDTPQKREAWLGL